MIPIKESFLDISTSMWSTILEQTKNNNETQAKKNNKKSIKKTPAQTIDLKSDSDRMIKIQRRNDICTTTF